MNPIDTNIIARKSILHTIGISVLDFFFPKPDDILVLEKLSHWILLEKAPLMPPLFQKHLYAFLPYQDPDIKKAIFEIKYRKNIILAELFAKVIHARLNPLNSNPHQYILLPIPASKNRMRTYGYNQTLLVARCLEKIDPIHFKISTALIYNNQRSGQKHKNRTERLESSESIFSIKNQSEISGKHVIVLDDIITTGATCLDALRAVHSAGATHALAIALVH